MYCFQEEENDLLKFLRKCFGEGYHVQTNIELGSWGPLNFLLRYSAPFVLSMSIIELSSRFSSQTLPTKFIW